MPQVSRPLMGLSRSFRRGPPMMNQAVFKLLDDLGVELENIAYDDFGG